MSATNLAKVPLYFGSPERPMFGFYHPAAGPRARATGVLLCNPLGDDLIRAHRPFRHLAEDLSAAGFPVLRFDFDGTGDSAGDERDPNRVATWRADVARAAAELRARSGVERLALVGLRLGGTFAALGASDLAGVEALVLWGAYDSGRAFVSEATKAHKMLVMLQPTSFSGGPPASDGQEALGFLLANPTVADLGAVDLLSLSRSPAKRTLILDTANVETDSPLVAKLRELGGTVTHQLMPGNKFLIVSPQQSEIPTAAISAITGWLGEQFPFTDSGSVTGSAASGPKTPAMPDLSPTLNSLRERPVFFGGGRRLFGILTVPPPATGRPELPPIILLNAGTVHRVGSHRLYVPMARKWAALGFHVLRVDLSGIGDSPVPEGHPENLTYPRDGLEDARAAMDFLEETTTSGKFIVAGLCSGGDIAFQLGFKEPRVASAIMMNPRTFLVNDLSMVDSYERARWSQQSVAKSDSWRDLLSGDVNLKRVFKLAARRVKDIVGKRAKRAVTSRRGAVPPAVQPPNSAGRPTCPTASERWPNG